MACEGVGVFKDSVYYLSQIYLKDNQVYVEFVSTSTSSEIISPLVEIFCVMDSA